MNIVEMKGITKIFNGKVTALDSVAFHLKKGEIHSLLGENGAGKSTLMKILYGLYPATNGQIFINGKEVEMNSSLDAIAQGIGMVHQHFMLADVLTVAENIVVGSEPTKFRYDKVKANKVVKELIDRFNFNLDPNARVEDLSVGQQQRVEILKLMYRKAEIMILDEPTAVLTPLETIELFNILKSLKESGKTIILITHKLYETIAIADTISVLRKGKMIEMGIPLGNATKKDLATMMVGRGVSLDVKRRSTDVGDVYYSVKDLNYTKNKQHILKDISFDIKQGEILGIAGVEGNGQTELIECLTGISKPEKGTVTLHGKQISGDVLEHLGSGVGHIPEDRNDRGLVNTMKITENMILGYHRDSQFQSHGMIKKQNIDDYAKKLVDMYDVRTASIYEDAGSLSGGNQQKVVVARVFEQQPKVVIVAQPTRGIDVGAMEYIHNRILEMRDQGILVLLISSDLDELRNLSDRLIVMFEGEIVSGDMTDSYDDTRLSSLMNSGEE